MNIISGIARNTALAPMQGDEVRPTAGRAREALFASLGDLNGAGVLDLCSGSGALALEAASRGAAWAVMVEKNPAHLTVIRENCRRVSAAGCRCTLIPVEADILDCPRYLPQLPGTPDVIFADPPYAVSAELAAGVLGKEAFTAALRGAKLIWEVPDTPGAAGDFLRLPGVVQGKFRKFGGTLFLLGVIG